MTCRDASYATQPLELLNELGFGSANNKMVEHRQLDASDDATNMNSESALADGSSRGFSMPGTLDGSEGVYSTS